MVVADTTEWVNLDAIQLWDKNYNRGDIAYLKRSFRQFGFNAAIRIWQGNVTYAGNHSTKVLRELRDDGWEPTGGGIRVVDDVWQVKFIDISHLNEPEATAFAIADNDAARRAQPDKRLLAEVLLDLQDYAPHLLTTLDFDTEAIDRLLKFEVPPSNTDESTTADTKTDLATEAQEKWGVEVGEVWVIPTGHKTRHRLMCGDCRSAADVAYLLDGQKVNGVFTSPPYAQQRQSEYGGVPAHEYVDWFAPIVEAIKPNLAPDGSLFINIKPHVEAGARTLYVFDLVTTMVRLWGWQLIDEFTWLRNGVPGAWRNRFKNGFEPVYHFALTPDCKFMPGNISEERGGKGGGSQNANTGGYYNVGAMEWDETLPSNVLNIRTNAAGLGHPAAFPVELPAWFVQTYSNAGDHWYDPFMGSGTLFEACQQYKRIGFGMEIKPDYCAIALERMSKLGLKPERD